MKMKYFAILGIVGVILYFFYKHFTGIPEETQPETEA